MQIVHVRNSEARALSGPGDLVGIVPNRDEGERLIISGVPSVQFVGYWATAIGVFAALGGAIEWRSV